MSTTLIANSNTKTYVDRDQISISSAKQLVPNLDKFIAQLSPTNEGLSLACNENMGIEISLTVPFHKFKASKKPTNQLRIVKYQFHQR